MPAAEPDGSLYSIDTRIGAHALRLDAGYLIFEVDDLDVAAAMVQAVRETVDGVRLDTYVTFELRVGRPFWAREEHE